MKSYIQPKIMFTFFCGHGSALLLPPRAHQVKVPMFIKGSVRVIWLPR